MKVTISDKKIITRNTIKQLKDLKDYFDLSDNDVVSVLNFVKHIKAKKDRLLNQDLELLTCREQQVFKLMISGLKTREIAEVLSISMATVSTHRKRIKQKLEYDDIVDWYNTTSYDLYQKQIS